MTESATAPSPPPARDRLIAAAAELFAEKSFGGVSVREICKQAGTGINMIHHYFGNKDGLLDVIVQQYETGVFAVPLRLLGTPAKSHDDLVSRVEMLFETTLEACLANRNVMMVVIREQTELKTLVAYQEAFSAFLDDAKSKGLIRPELDGGLISGAMLDRIINQVQFAPWVKRTSGLDIQTDATYRAEWCVASVDLFLNGMLPRH